MKNKSRKVEKPKNIETPLDAEVFDRKIYDPKDRGCLRDGLRVRKYCRVWWVNNASHNGLGCIYSSVGKNDNEEEDKDKTLVNKRRLSLLISSIYQKGII